MRLHSLRLASALATCSLLLPCLSAVETSRAKSRQQEKPASTVVFVVSRSAEGATIEPILTIGQGGYKQPVAGDSDVEEISRFAARYYRKGQKYRVLFGGGEAGSLTVKESTKDSECFRTGANVALQTQAGLNTNVMALATNADSLGRAKGSRRAPTASERAAALSLARDAYKQKGVPASLLPSLTTVNLTATDLDGDGQEELIGSFVVKKRKGGEARYVLFLLAEPQGKGYRAGLTQYGHYTEKDIMSGGSIDAIGEGGIYTERLVDQLDLDGDAAAEVITLQTGFEGVSYVVYRKQQGKWQKIYDFGNYRCAF